MRSGTPYELDVEMFSHGGRRWVTARGEGSQKLTPYWAREQDILSLSALKRARQRPPARSGSRAGSHHTDRTTTSVNAWRCCRSR
jgi:hypothetical protein